MTPLVQSVGQGDGALVQRQRLGHRFAIHMEIDLGGRHRLTDEQRLQIRLEVGEWNLQKNNMDQAVQSYFDDAMTWYRDNGRKLLEAKKQDE